jgi:DNA-binding MarR family transcriptional regulator
MQDKIYENYIKDIVNALRQISVLLYHNSREMKQKYGISGPQLLVLKTIVEAEAPLSAIGISRSLNVSPANITGMIDRLEKMGLVERHRKEDDRRTINILPTQEGIELSQKTTQLIEEKLISGLKDLTRIEISSIYLSLEKIIAIAGEEQIEELPYDQLS